MSNLAKLFHLVAVVHFYYGIYFWDTLWPAESKFRRYEYGGKLVYLTFINCKFFPTLMPLIFIFVTTRSIIIVFHVLSFLVVFQAFYFTIALFNDFIGSNKVLLKDQPLIRKIRDYCFAAFGFPLAMDVGGLFWLLYAIDRELVFPIGFFCHNNSLSILFISLNFFI